MTSISVKFAGLSGKQDVTLTVEDESEATVAAAREQAGISPDLTIRLGGQPVAKEQESATQVSDGDTLVTTPPQAKQG